MPFFQRSYYVEDPLTNLFRVFDDIEKQTRQSQHSAARSRRQAFHFNPRFDVRETETAYELHGELPGVNSKDVEIEFPEPQTLVVRGHTERHYDSAAVAPAVAVDTPAAVTANEDTLMSGAASAGAATPDAASDISAGWHQASVADEADEEATLDEKAAVAVATPAPAAVEKKAEEPAKPKDRYHHRERAIGQFRRTFTFPNRVDETAVSAALKNGLLHVTIPKAPKHEIVRVAVN